MGGQKRRASWILVALGVLTPVAVSRAEPHEQEPIRADLAAPAGCPGAQEFLNQVFLRTRRARAAQPSEPARTFSVAIEQQAAAWVGTLRVMTPTRELVERRVDAETCGEVVEALALVAALIVDPEALSKPLSPGPAAEEPRDEPPSRTFSPAPVREPLRPPAPPKPEPTCPAWRVGLGGELMRGTVKDALMPVGRIWTEIRWRGRGLWQPTVGLGLALGGAKIEGNIKGKEIYLWITERLSLCPVALSAHKLTVGACALADVGVIESQPGSSAGSTTRWFGLGGGLKLYLNVASPLVFRLETGALWQATRTTFAFRLSPSGQDEVWTTPAVGGFVGLGAGINL